MLKALCAIVIFLTYINPVSAQTNKWGDQHDGTYANPVLPGDFQGIDVTRLGADYFCVVATKEQSPGMMVLTSKDLVNWKIISHAVEDITQISSKYNYDKMNGLGITSGTIRYHDNKFCIYFTDPDEGVFLATAMKATGPWKPIIQLLKAPGWSDACPLWDENGDAYLTATNLIENKTHLFKMSADGDKLLTETDKVIQQGKERGGNRIYKIKNYYYHFYNEVTPEGRMPFVARANAITGPYLENHQLMHKAVGEPNQGAMVQNEKGEWYFLIQNGTPKWDGHEVSLLPVNWLNDWPTLGTTGKDGIGTIVWAGRKPANDANAVSIQTSDDFSGKTMSPQWGWFFQPNGDKWSLTERPGYLRLYSSKPLEPGVISKTPNILMQRTLRLEQSIATVKFDIAHMTDGQIAGLSLFGKTITTLGIVQSGSSRRIYFGADGKTKEGQEIDIANVWLRSIWDANGLAQFFYSTDGMNYDPFGDPFSITNSDNDSGPKIGFYTADDSGGTGFIDVDWFHYGTGN
jgi:beta-xylosidase